ATHLDALVGSEQGAARTSADGMLRSFVVQTIGQGGNGSFDQAQFDIAYDALRSYVDSPRLALKAVAPLYGFLTETFPIEFPPHVRLRELTAHELDRLADTSNPISLMRPHLLGYPRFALEYTWSMPKWIGGSPVPESGEHDEPDSQVVLSRILDALR